MATFTENMSRPAPTEADSESHGPHGTSISEEHGVMVVRDLRMFRRGEEAFCRRLAVAAANQADVRSVRISLESSTCRIEFAPGRVDPKAMADRFVKAVREAVSGSPAEGKKERRDSKWGALVAFPASGGASLWEIMREAPDQLKAHHAMLRFDSSLAREVAKALRTQPGVVACRVSPWRRTFKITYDPGHLPDLAVVDSSEAILQHRLRPEPEPATSQGTPAVARGPRRWYYLALAGGSFTLTVVGLVVPGIPTVPFLMATSYYLARSSPRLNKALSRSWFFGPIVTDLEKSGGLQPINKAKLIGLTLAICALTLVVAGPSLIVVLIMLAVASASFYAINRIPVLPSEKEKPTPTALTPAPA